MYNKVKERFVRYIKIDTQSSEDAKTFPSTSKQHNLATVLYEELISLGAKDVVYDRENCYVYAKIPGNLNEEPLGFIAHMDTSPDMSGCNVNPKFTSLYDGQDIILSENGEYVLSPKEFPELLKCKGKTVITSDGTTLLGADDKAGIAEIMTMAEVLLKNPSIEHRPISIAFTPDEEVGNGVEHFDVQTFGAPYAYTVDGGAIGELEYENFNAAGAHITFTGRNVHPGEAKNKMINAMRLAFEFNSRLPQNEKPENTSGYEGFFHLTDMSGNVEHAELFYIIRDHDRTLFENKKHLIHTMADDMNTELKRDCVSATVKDSYYNMREKIEKAMFLVDNAKEAMLELSITPLVQPIRGGTDGARLSFMGIPCPNLCTGGANYHSRYEYCCVEDMAAISELLVRLASK